MNGRRFSLKTVRADIRRYCERLRDRGGSYGSYRRAPGARPDLYASLDIAIMRTVMGEDLAALPLGEREQWVAHINSFADGYNADGRFADPHRGHSPLHANGMAIGALGALGGRQAAPVSLYEPFRAAEGAIAWLERFDWARQWRESHGFWGGLLCYSFASDCSATWRAAVLDWLDANLDAATGWWRKGGTHADPSQPLGGAAHIVPMYQHHGRPHPMPERVIDSTLALQRPDGKWRDDESRPPLSYLELDALYMYRYMRELAPSYRANELLASAGRMGDVAVSYYRDRRDDLLARHPHEVLAAAGVFGLLQHLLPDRFVDDVTWSDIFSDRRLYKTQAVQEVAGSAG